MSAFLSAYVVFLAGLKKSAFVVVAALAVIALVDWAVRTRRISPFGPIGRFMRGSVDPLMAPVERRIVRAGGLPAHAPWWSLVAVTVGSIVLISLLQFVGDQLRGLAMSAGMGPGAVLLLAVHWTFGLLRLAIIVRVISSWVSVSPYVWWIRWSYVLTEPILGPLRRVIPSIGMIDITPIVAYFLLGLTESVLFSFLGR